MIQNRIICVIAIVKNQHDNLNYCSSTIDRTGNSQSRMYTHTHKCVARRARSVGRANVCCSNYSLWNIFHLIQFQTIRAVRKYIVYYHTYIVYYHTYIVYYHTYIVYYHTYIDYSPIAAYCKVFWPLSNQPHLFSK